MRVFTRLRVCLMALILGSLLASSVPTLADDPAFPWVLISSQPRRARVGTARDVMHNDTDYQSSFNTPEGHFVIYYNASGEGAPQDTTDGDSDGVPDYVEKVGEFMEYGWQKQITDLGFRQPKGTESTRYEVWIETMTDTYGYMSYSPSLPTSTSYIAINSALSAQNNYAELRVTVAHEFFHAIQVSYDTQEPVWWMEGGAVWMEDYLYDDTNSYNEYISIFFNTPEYGFDMQEASDAREYASFMVVQYISEVLGASSIRSLWEACEGSTTIYQAMNQQTKTTADIFRGFATWAYTREYSESSSMPTLTVNATETSYPVDRSPTTRLPEKLGTNFIVFQPSSSTDQTLDVTFEGRSGREWVATLVAKSAAGSYQTTAINLTNDAGSVSLQKFGATVTEACLIVSSVQESHSTGNTYRYTARLSDSTGDSGTTTSNTGDTGTTTTNTGDSGDTSTNTGDTGSTTTDTGDTGDTSTDSGDTGSTSDSGDTPQVVTPTSISVNLSANASTYTAGDPLTVSLSLSGSATADVYIALFLPTGQYFCLTSINQLGALYAVTPLVQNWSISTLNEVPVLQLPALPALPAGEYKMLIILTTPGGDVIYPPHQLATDQVTFTIE